MSSLLTDAERAAVQQAADRVLTCTPAGVVGWLGLPAAKLTGVRRELRDHDGVEEVGA